MARSPYHIARQEHVGDFLDELQARGLLTWEWRYDTPNSTALYFVTLPGQPRKRYLTKEVEGLAQSIANDQQIVWVPVKHPGGVNQLAEAEQLILQMKNGVLPTPWET